MFNTAKDNGKVTFNYVWKFKAKKGSVGGRKGGVGGGVGEVRSFHGLWSQITGIWLLAVKFIKNFWGEPPTKTQYSGHVHTPSNPVSVQMVPLFVVCIEIIEWPFCNLDPEQGNASTKTKRNQTSS